MLSSTTRSACPSRVNGTSTRHRPWDTTSATPHPSHMSLSTGASPQRSARVLDVGTAKLHLRRLLEGARAVLGKVVGSAHQDHGPAVRLGTKRTQHRHDNVTNTPTDGRLRESIHTENIMQHVSVMLHASGRCTAAATRKREPGRQAGPAMTMARGRRRVLNVTVPVRSRVPPGHERPQVQTLPDSSQAVPS